MVTLPHRGTVHEDTTPSVGWLGVQAWSYAMILACTVAIETADEDSAFR